MKVLIVDQEGLALSYALRARDAGHQVRWFVKPDKAVPPDIGKGFKGVEIVKNWVEHVKWSDLRFCTFNADYLEKMEFFAKQGYPFFGPSPQSAKMEISRKDGMLLMEKCGIDVVPYKTFGNMNQAKKHIEKTQERYVFKTMGDNEDKSLTYVAKSPEDMLAWIERTPPPKGEVMLQNFVEGIEMGVSRFMGSKGWVGQWNESFEHKKMMSSNFGPNTGEMGTIAYFTKKSKLGDDTLAKVEEAFLKLGHLGDLAVGFMIDDKGKPWPTEFTVRLGWPIANMMLGATKGDPVEWMKDALDGKDTTTFTEDIGCCLVMALPPFPSPKVDYDEVSHIPVFGVTKGTEKHLHPQAIQLEKVLGKDMWTSAGEYALVVDGFGASVSQAAKRAYGTVDKISLSNAIVRDDVGEKLKETLPKLHALGFATHCHYGS